MNTRGEKTARVGVSRQFNFCANSAPMVAPMLRHQVCKDAEELAVQVCTNGFGTAKKFPSAEDSKRTLLERKPYYCTPFLGWCRRWCRREVLQLPKSPYFLSFIGALIGALGKGPRRLVTMGSLGTSQEKHWRTIGARVLRLPKIGGKYIYYSIYIFSVPLRQF